MTYDAATRDIVLFGGTKNITTQSNLTLADTWIFDNGTWHQDVDSPSHPSARVGACMAYDYADGYVVLFGGMHNLTINDNVSYQDTWKFQNGTWTELNLTTHPSARGFETMVWDSEDDYLLMYGGASSSTDVHSDTWVFRGGLWRNLTTSTHPPPLYGASMAYDQSDHYVLLFGGETPSSDPEGGQDLAQTWSYANGTWTNLTSSVGQSPDGRLFSSMAFDPSEGFVVLFGGWNTSTGETFGDTWFFTGGKWSIYFLSPPASGLFGASFSESGPASGPLLFGGVVGLTSYNATNATWVFGTLAPTEYEVTFVETGLPVGTAWSVTLNGTLNTSKTANLTFTEPNGTFAFTIPELRAYIAKPSSGSLTVAGEEVNQSVTFSRPTYAVTFAESGLPSGTSWWVILNGTNSSSATSYVTFSERNGTYLYSISIGGGTGYHAFPPSGNVTVNGSAQTISIVFSWNGGNSGVSPYDDVTLYVIVSAIVIVVVAAVVVLLMRRRNVSTAKPQPPAGPPTPPQER